ncbi:MAG: hypothetical protein JW820_12840 [Spirochaetales bacterium]|nr:hypothetical protein [Spirochaetales bacterium]
MGREVAFASLSPDTPQEEIQGLLEEVHRRHGLPAALEGLLRFELAAGYLTREKLEEVERLSWADPETGVSFRIQVNFARSRYQPPPASPDRPPGDTPPGEDAPCLLCKGNIGRPGKERLRVYEFPLDGRQRRFFVQLTPFPLFPYHYVLILCEHRPQNIDAQTLPDMFAFLEQAPGYTACSNSDVEWAGSSILNHLHYQVFKDLRLPVMDARGIRELTAQIGGCRVEALDYPMSALRLRSLSAAAVQQTGSQLIALWKSWDPGRNTVNLVLVRGPGAAGAAEAAGAEYRLTVLLRNPDFRTPPELQRFKSEGVGVIEASGEAILPVPRGEDAERSWAEIRERGLAIVKGIIRGNSPGLSPDRLAGLLEALQSELP